MYFIISLKDISNATFTLTVCAIAVLLWSVWRLWSFTISPIINPNQPKTLPYLFPWIGHIPSFINNSNSLITNARLYFRNTREPFALVLGGQYVYMITSAKDVTAVLKNTSQLTFDTYIEDMQLRFGATPDAVKIMWKKPTQEYIYDRLKNQGFPNPHGKVLTHVSEAIFKAQMHPGARMSKLSANLLRIIYQRAAWKSMPDSVIQERNSKDTERIISLKNWIRYVLLYAATSCFFGEAIFRLDRDILEYFAAFDEDSWQFTYQVPRVFARKMFRAKTRAQNVFNDYFDLPVTQRSDASWMVLTLESEMRAAGIGSKDISAYLMMLYWVINGNAWKAAFWLSSYILLDTRLQKSVEKEIKPLFNSADPKTPNEIMDQLEASSLLVACYNETLRVCTSSVGVRNVAEDCIVGEKVLQKGSRLIIPYNQMLMDENVFGRNPEKFNHHRFLDQPSLAKDPSFRPFSGGLTYCPGRFLAQKEILSLVSLILGIYSTTVQGTEQEAPKMERKKPSLGMVGPKAGEDLYVIVKID